MKIRKHECFIILKEQYYLVYVMSESWTHVCKILMSSPEEFVAFFRNGYYSSITVGTVTHTIHGFNNNASKRIRDSLETSGLRHA